MPSEKDMVNVLGVLTPVHMAKKLRDAINTPEFQDTFVSIMVDYIAPKIALSLANKIDPDGDLIAKGIIQNLMRMGELKKDLDRVLNPEPQKKT